MDLLAQLDASTWGIAGACSALTGVGTFLATKGVDAWMKLRADQRAEVDHNDGRILKGYQLAIDELKARVSTVEQALVKSQADHLDCERRHAILEQKVQRLSALGDSENK